MTKGREKKPPELVHYWNCELSKEIEAEVDLYLQRLFFVAHPNPLHEIPKLDYVADGFASPGVTVLFGGDHGDQHCPIACKINLASPTIRKEKQQLGYHCPMIVFGSVECTTDAYDLMKSTVMPMVKKQLKELQESAVVTVYQRTNITKVFRSYTVPSTIHPGTIAFLEGTIEGTNDLVTRMTFGYGGGRPIRLGPLTSTILYSMVSNTSNWEQGGH